MVNVPPPLLCSTPPPIDFGEDDDDSGLQSTLHLEDVDADEFSEFGLVTDTHDAGLNAKLPPLPELPISSVEYNAQSLPPDLSNGNAKKSEPAVEAFNYEVKAPELQLEDQQEMPVPEDNGNTNPDELEQHQDEDEDVEEEEEEANTNDNVPSLKLDSLSLYSSESITPPSTLSPVADEGAAKAPPVITHQVTLEDVSDDSDEECSPKKPKELFIPEGAADFFAIEIVDTPTQKTPAVNTQIPDPETVPHFAAFPDTPPEDTAPRESSNVGLNNVDDADEHEDDDDDFGDFADFSAAPTFIEPQQPTQSMQPASQDDGFDDFQDFATPPTTVIEAQAVAQVAEDDEDDFGDFEEPAFVSDPPPAAAAVAPVLPQPPPPAAMHLSITERVKPVLELMFPTLEASDSSQLADKHAPLAETQTLQFGAIEQAHALYYQWSNSEMRHSLVRSLAIDSRNILFGDKWNASMPRFAANLSFDPLKPLKPTTAGGSTHMDTQQAPAASWQPLQGLDTAAAAAPAPAPVAGPATETSQAKAQPGPAHGQSAPGAANGSADETIAATQPPTARLDDAPTAASAFAASAAAAPLSPALSADGNGFGLGSDNDNVDDDDDDDDDTEQQQQQQQQQLQQQLDLRESPPPVPIPSATSAAAAPPPTATPIAAVLSSQQLHEVTTNSASFTLPLKETHIYTPSKSDTAVAKTTTLAPIDFDYEIASAGIIIDETVVKKEYRDVEYKPPYGLDSPSKLSATGKSTAAATATAMTTTTTDDDDFSDFQSVPAVRSAVAQLQPPRNGTPTFGEQMILSPAILLPQTIPLSKPSIEWGDNALNSINAEEMARIEELFAHQVKPPTISATVAQQPPKQQQQQQDDDEWSDFVSVPVQQQQQQQQQQNSHINNVPKTRNAPTAAAATAAAAAASIAKEDDWSDFVSSSPLPARAAPQFNSGAWQSANFYNNPMSLYHQQQQQQQAPHSNVLPKYHNSNNHNNNNNNKNNNNVPQQIHMMHDFSTAPTALPAATATYQQQHHQHHQQQLQQQQKQQHRQQFHLGNAKVAPRISLIPDLSFVAPALPTNAGAFMSSLPKPSFSAKK